MQSNYYFYPHSTPMTDKTKEFLEKLKASGHWNDDYDYSLIDYRHSHKKIKIVCKKHGVFEQRPTNHLKGGRCKKCVFELKDTSEILNEFKLAHGDRYDYSLVEYKGVSEQVKIICHDHGLFEQSPLVHKKGSNCPKCAVDLREKKRRQSLESIILKFQEKHGDRYDYSLVKYISTHKKVKIICHVHGEFEQSPGNHIRGQNCPKCSGKGKSQEEILNDFRTIHGVKYDYSLVHYKSATSKIKIICKDHGVF